LNRSRRLEHTFAVTIVGSASSCVSGFADASLSVPLVGDWTAVACADDDTSCESSAEAGTGNREGRPLPKAPMRLAGDRALP
jgi:hypothetical protein